MSEPQCYLDVCVDGTTQPLTINTHTLIPAEQLTKNIVANLLRPVPRFLANSGFMKLVKEPLAIVAAGPSLNETIEQLRGFKNVLVCGSAHDHLVRLGVTPTYAIVCDAGEEDWKNLQLAQPETIFLIASQCAPNLFEHLAGHKVEMWHYRGQVAPTPEEEARILGGEPSIAWGTTVTLTAIHVAMHLGFQDLHFFGFDSCYGDYGLKHHCCEIHGALEYEKVPFKVGDKMFVSDLGLAMQAQQFYQLVEVDGQFFHSTIYGNGLIAEMARQGEPGLERYVSLA